MGIIAAGIGAGVLGAAGGIFGSALQPGTPGTMGILDNALSSFYGVNPSNTIALQKDQTKLAALQASLAGASPKAQKKIQAQIDALSTKETGLETKIGDLSQEGYSSQFLAGLSSMLPQLQQISQSQNTAAAQSALGLQNQFGTQAGQSILNSQEALAPQYYQGRNQLGSYLSSNLGQGLTPAETAYYNQQFLGNQSAMGLGSSPLGAQNSAYQLAGLNMQQTNTNEGMYQNYLNSYLQPQVPNLFGTFSPTNAQGLGGNSLSSLSPTDLLNLSSNLAGLKYSQQSQQANAIGNGISSIGSGLLGMFGPGGGTGNSLAGLSGFFGGTPVNTTNQTMASYGFYPSGQGGNN